MPKRKKKRKFIVSITDFGAKGDGFSDDSAAFAAAAQSRAICIMLPPGNYQISNGVRLDHRFVSTERDQ
jgi:polygalacturonase